jgi:hypothetical protein
MSSNTTLQIIYVDDASAAVALDLLILEFMGRELLYMRSKVWLILLKLLFFEFLLTRFEPRLHSSNDSFVCEDLKRKIHGETN